MERSAGGARLGAAPIECIPPVREAFSRAMGARLPDSTKYPAIAPDV